jgi:hypothetical protein
MLIPVSAAVRDAGERRRGRLKPSLRLPTAGPPRPRQQARRHKSGSQRVPPPASSVPGAFRR